MGVQVAITLDTMLKPSYTVSTVLTAAFAPANGQLVLCFCRKDKAAIEIIKRNTFCGKIWRSNREF